MRVRFANDHALSPGTRRNREEADKGGQDPMPGGSKERARRRAREHYERQRQARMARRKKIQRWTLTGTIIVMVAGLAVGPSPSFFGGGTTKGPSSAKGNASPPTNAPPPTSAPPT